MMQLVNDRVHILNPPKDNLICDAAKVEEILGVPPERVIDVMALRGDSIDNIPGAPGNRRQGFGGTYQALRLRRAGARPRSEVEKRPIANRCRTIATPFLFSKSMATIDCNVPVELNVEAMRAGEPDLEPYASFLPNWNSLRC
jgi:DNA polymerase I